MSTRTATYPGNVGSVTHNVQRLASQFAFGGYPHSLNLAVTRAYPLLHRWISGCTSRTVRKQRALGGTLTVIYTAQSEVAQKKTRGALLPLLVILFLISYGIL